ncbi:MAG: TAXI family TRAP transporter solute-binding subunit [Pararhodobacter sp.]|nr:TAXI family TRAP transporter solute-binding subunit [Pararhodobacter sp.]
MTNSNIWTRRLALGAILAAGFGTGAVAQDRLDLGFATSASGGTGYMYAVAVATVVNDANPDIRITAFPTAGVIENDRLLRQGEAQLILHTGGQAYDSFAGEGSYDGPFTELRALWPIYASLVQMAVPTESDVHRPADLQGMRVGLGEPGSSANRHVRQVLEAEGVGDGDYQARPNSLNEQVAGIRDGNLDALTIIMGASAPALQDLATSRDVRFLSLSEETISEVQGMNPPGSVVPVTIPMGAYRGQEAPINTFGLPIWVMALESTPDDVVERIVGTFFDNIPAAAEVHPVVNETTPEFVAGAMPPVPWHEGALRALRDRDIDIIIPE